MPSVVPVLARATGREMLGEAMNIIKAAAPAERAALAKELLAQVSARATGGGWKAAEMAGANGARAWLGDTHALVIDAAGGVFKGPNGGLQFGLVDGKIGVTGWSGLSQAF